MDSAGFDELNAHFEQQKARHEAQQAEERRASVDGLRKAVRIQSARRAVEHPKTFAVQAKSNAGEKLFLREPSRLPEGDAKLGQAIVPGTRFDGTSFPVPFHKPEAQVMKGSPAFPGTNNDVALPPRVSAMMATLGIDSLPSSVPFSSSKRTARTSLGNTATTATTATLTTAAAAAGSSEGSRLPSPYRTTQSSPQGAAGSAGSAATATAAVTISELLPPQLPSTSSPSPPLRLQQQGRVSSPSKGGGRGRGGGAGGGGGPLAPKASPPGSTHSSRQASPVRAILDRAEMEERKRFWLYLTTTLGRQEIDPDEAELLFNSLTRDERSCLALLPAAMPPVPVPASSRPSSASGAGEAGGAGRGRTKTSTMPAPGAAASSRPDDRFARAHDFLSARFAAASGPGPGASTALSRTAIGHQSVRQSLVTARSSSSSSSAFDPDASAAVPRSPSPASPRGSPRASRSPSPLGPGPGSSFVPAHHPRPWRRGQTNESLPHRQLFSYHASAGANTVGLTKIAGSSAAAASSAFRPSSPTRR